MPEQAGVGEFSPPYYISQLRDSLIISGSFGFGNFRIIYAWALEFEDGIILSCNLLFTIPHPAPKENDYGCKFFYGKRNESVYYSVLRDLHRLQVIPQKLHHLIAIPQEVQHHKTISQELQ
uniref:Uncharacterized protein n=1 Tax=Tanacetum cinerariifolium TaxID=118510 RepID=A0A699IBT2_TANCI|nr:hypothetical protein [Tanacetum cinerariifolium]